jgi:hypothetical protein
VPEEFAFDPRKLIFSPLRECPKCGKSEFGVFQVAPDHCERLCGNCRASQTFKLPQIRKAIIYLDQFAISNLSHVRTKDKVVDQFWHDVYAKLTSLHIQQLIVCPKSVAHMIESETSTRNAEFQASAEMFAHNVFFADFETIRHTLILKALDAWIAGDTLIPNVTLDDICHGSPHGWMQRWRFVATMPSISGYAAALRADRDAAHAGLVSVFESKWKKGGETWEHWYDEEARAFGNETIRSYNRERQKWEDLASGKRKLQNEFDSLVQPVLELGRVICYKLEASGVGKDELPHKAGEFLKSDLLIQTHFVRISSSLYASLAMKAPGQNKQPTKGFFSDVDVMSCLLPYCDAMLLDRECVGYWHEVQSSQNHKLPYDTEVFSLAAKEEFLNYLDEIENSAAEDHLALVREIYNYPRQQA